MNRQTTLQELERVFTLTFGKKPTDEELDYFIDTFDYSIQDLVNTNYRFWFMTGAIASAVLITLAWVGSDYVAL